MTRGALFAFLRKELRDLRGNRQLWPAHLALPLVAVVLPALLLWLLPLLTDPAQHDGGIDLLLQTIAHDPSITGATLQERMARLLLRDFGVFYLLIPVILASGGAALALVREKEQRTLEPILATPLRDRDLVVAKTLAAVGPALLMTWIAGLAGSLTGAVGSWIRVGVPILPTAGSVVSLVLLAPALAAVAALLGLRVSARFTDVQGATQYTGLVVVPIGLVVVALLGRPAMASPAAGLASAAGLALLALWLYGRNVRRFRREELLTRWR